MSLNGLLAVNFNEVIVAASATLQLGTPGSTAGFRFQFAVEFNCYGRLEDVTGHSGGIFLPKGSSFNFFTGAVFLSVVPTFLIIFDPVTGEVVGTSLALSVTFTGPFFVTVSDTGVLTTSTIRRTRLFSVLLHFRLILLFFRTWRRCQPIFVLINIGYPIFWSDD